MSDTILINRTFSETRVAFLKNNKLFELYIERTTRPKVAGNIYKARVNKVIPGMQAAFVDYGDGRAGFISAEDVYSESFESIFIEQDDEVQNHKFNNSLIQDVLKEGQEILVQVLKNPTSGKGAKLSSNIALPGKYLVLLGMVDFVGVSKRIEDSDERDGLINLIHELKPEGIGFISRTASQGKDRVYLENDLNHLLDTWNQVKSKSDNSTAPVLLYSEPNLYLKVIRDLVTDNTIVIIDSQEYYNDIKEFINNYFPEINIKMELYSDQEPLFLKYGVEAEIEKMFDKKVWLKSGGYLIIEEAEALTVIDVNTGKYLSGDDQDETIYHIDKEAAIEIARQIKIRNLVGIIVIDFIDLKDPEQSSEIYELFVNEMKDDKSRTVIHEMSQFSVVQLTRQKLRESVIEYLSDDCDQCGGTGYVKSPDTTAYEIIRELQAKLSQNKCPSIKIVTSPGVIEYLNMTEEVNIKQLGQNFDTAIILVAGNNSDKPFEIIIG
jgi:ribonuclease G